MGPTLPVVVARPLVGVAHPPGKGGPIREVPPRHVRHGTWIRILKLVVRVPPLQRRGGKAAALPFRRRLHPTRSSVFGIGGHWQRPRTQVDRHTANLFAFVVPHLSSPTAGISSAVPPNCNVSTVKWKNLHHETRILGEQILAKLVMTPHRNSLFFAAHFNYRANVALAK